MQLAITMLEHHVHLVAEMVDRAGRLSDDQLDAPIVLSVEGIDDDPTVRRLLSRLVGQLQMWNSSMSGVTDDWGVEQHESLDSMRDRLDDAGPRFVDRMRGLAEGDRLGDSFVDATCEPPEAFTYGGVA